MKEETSTHARASHRSFFTRLSHAISVAVGKPIAFIGACSIVVAWAALGPIFDFSDTWQLVINTGTTIITFLMVFLIQNTQNRDTIALQLKLDELIVSMKAAHNDVIDIEDMDEAELVRIHDEIVTRAKKAGIGLRKTDGSAHE